MTPTTPEVQTATKILLAEDDVDQREDLTEFLVHSGYEVESVSSGTELLDALAEVTLGLKARPDVIITDIQMPGVPGLNVAEELRAEGWNEPIIVISAFGPLPLIALRLEQLDDVRFVAKPFDPDKLVEMVHELTK